MFSPRFQSLCAGLFFSCFLMGSCNNDRVGSANRFDRDDYIPGNEAPALSPDSVYAALVPIDTSSPNESPHFEFDPGEEMRATRYNKVKNMLAFHINDTMAVGTTYYATLGLGRNVSLARMEEEINEIYQPGASTELIDTSLQVSLQMSATLEDKSSENDPNFTITPLGEAVSASTIRKYDPKENSMLWRWKVTAIKEGTHELILTIAEIDKRGEPRNAEYRQYRVMIFAEKKSINPDSPSFLSKNWQWLIGVIIMPLFVAWFTTRRRNRSSKSSY